MNSSHQPDNHISQPKLLVLLLKAAYGVYLTIEGKSRKSFKRFFTHPAHKHDFDDLFKKIGKLSRNGKSENEKTADILKILLPTILKQQAKYVKSLKAQKYRRPNRQRKSSLTDEQRLFLDVLKKEPDQHHFSRLLMCVLRRFDDISRFQLSNFLYDEYKLNSDYYAKVWSGHNNIELYKLVLEFSYEPEQVIDEPKQERHSGDIFIKNSNYDHLSNDDELENLSSHVYITNNNDISARRDQLTNYLQHMDFLATKFTEGLDNLPSVPRDHVVYHLKKLRELCSQSELDEARTFSLNVLSSFDDKIKITDNKRIIERKHIKLTEDERQLVNLALRLKSCTAEILWVFNHDIPFMIQRLQKVDDPLLDTLNDVLDYNKTDIIPDYFERLMFCFDIADVRAELNRLPLKKLLKLHAIFNDHRLLQLIEETTPMKKHLAEQKALRRHRISGYVDNILAGGSPVRADENKVVIDRLRRKK